MFVCLFTIMVELFGLYIPSCILRSIGKFSARTSAQALFHGVWTCSVEVIEVWSFYELNNQTITFIFIIFYYNVSQAQSTLDFYTLLRLFICFVCYSEISWTILPMGAFLVPLESPQRGGVYGFCFMAFQDIWCSQKVSNFEALMN